MKQCSISKLTILFLPASRNPYFVIFFIFNHFKHTVLCSEFLAVLPVKCPEIAQCAGISTHYSYMLPLEFRFWNKTQVPTSAACSNIQTTVVLSPALECFLSLSHWLSLVCIPIILQKIMPERKINSRLTPSTYLRSQKNDLVVLKEEILRRD